MRRTTLLLPLLAALALAGCSESGAGSDTSQAGAAKPASSDAGSLEEALSLAKRTDRPVLVEYASETCPYCRQMEAQVLSTPEVKKALEQVVFFRAVKGKTADAFEKAWGTPPTPSYAVLRPDGSAMGTLTSGVIAKSDFLSYIDWAVSGRGPMPTFRTGGG
jgi:thiol:disulfide interchange protein